MISLHSIKVSMKKKRREEEDGGGGESLLYRNPGWSVPECKFPGPHSRQQTHVMAAVAISMRGFHRAQCPFEGRISSKNGLDTGR